VTDLVSQAWCELQYYYTLSIHGRKVRTAAMKKGSVVHKELKDQIYTTVQVDIACKEKAWGLRIWNVIQGLKTLRETGQTRELEVWGLVEGQIVNGVIDEVAYACPDEELEAQSEREPNSAKSALDIEAPAQTSLKDYFQAQGATTLENATRLTHSEHLEPTNLELKTSRHKVYITDVKTRGSSSLLLIRIRGYIPGARTPLYVRIYT
jgi:exonuclease V